MNKNILASALKSCIKWSLEKWFLISYRLRNIFNCVLLQKRHLTVGLIYNDFGDTYPMQTFYKIMVMKCSHLKPFLSILCMYHINVSVWQIVIQHFQWPMALFLYYLFYLHMHTPFILQLFYWRYYSCFVICHITNHMLEEDWTHVFSHVKIGNITGVKSWFISCQDW